MLALLYSCSGSDSTGEAPFVKIDNRLHISSMTINNKIPQEGKYDLGLFIMKSIPQKRLDYVPQNSFYFNVHAQVRQASDGYTTYETFRKSTDTARIDTIKLSERSYIYSYAPFMATVEEPSATAYSYYGTRIPYIVNGGVDVLAGKKHNEIEADNLSNEDIRCRFDMKHVLTQMLFYVSNNTEDDTLTVFRLHMYGAPKTILNEFYLNAFTGEIDVDSTHSINHLTTDIAPGITLLPKQSSAQQIAMMFPSVVIDSARYGNLSISLEVYRNNRRDSVFYTDTLYLPKYIYESNHAYEMVATIQRGSPIYYTSNWKILNWNQTPTTSDKGGIHLQDNAYLRVVPWVDLQYTSDYYPQNPHPTVVIGTGDWTDEDTGSGVGGKSELATICFQLQTWITNTMEDADTPRNPGVSMNVYDWNSDATTSEIINKR